MSSTSVETPASPPESQASAQGQPGVPSEQNGGMPPGRRRLLTALGVVVAILVLVFGVKWFLYAHAHESTDDATVDADIVQVNAKIAERVDAIYVDTNQQVHKGELMARLADRDELDRLRAAQAALASAQAQARAAAVGVDLTQSTRGAQVQQSQGGVSSAQAGILSARADLSAATAQLVSSQAQSKAADAGVPAAREALAKADSDLRRTSQLVNEGALPANQLDAAKAAAAGALAQFQQAQQSARAADAAVRAARDRLRAARAGVSAAEAALTTATGKLAESSTPYRVTSQEAQAQGADAQVKNARAAEAQARAAVSYTYIYAPSNGYIGEKDITAGQMVAAGQMLFAIVPLDKIYITANYKETQIADMRPGQHVDITVDAYKGKTFSGHLVSIGPATGSTFSIVPAQNATGNFVKVTQRIPVRIELDGPNPDGTPLRPGMNVVTSVKVR
ncbi:MAG TPA: HlyD family secretion protein [Candidatus Dormibacteraeota bacterium]|nr:HlyD family secretion protein [Candidatus Dormibacteraeota bacterium]